MAPQPPLRVPAARPTHGALVAPGGAVVGAYTGAHMGEGLGENGWGVGLPLGAVAGGSCARAGDSRAILFFAISQKNA